MTTTDTTTSQPPAAASPPPDPTTPRAGGPRVALGPRGEEHAAHWLRDIGYEILDRNWRSGREGEIDIIARDGDCLVFVEVKTRAGTRHGTPFEAIDDRKRRRLRRLIGRWLQQRETAWPGPVRLDAIGVRLLTDGLVIEHRRGV